ncbi:MAG: ATPase P [Bacillota bacterium]|nr:ATPase P [Bacillota bacterium]MDW7677402.1 ATPase P [Bacillota bacterium]
MEITIPGRGKVHIKQAVFDYNGTLATDGRMCQGVREVLTLLTEYMQVVVLTADTYGTVAQELEGTGVKLHRFPSERAGLSKRNFVADNNPQTTLTVGNGLNDLPMTEISCLSIAVIGSEGCHGKLLAAADIVVKDVMDVFALLKNPDRIKATLRS